MNNLGRFLISFFMSSSLLTITVILDIEYQSLISSSICLVVLIVGMIYLYIKKKKYVAHGIAAVFIFILFLLMFLTYNLSKLH